MSLEASVVSHEDVVNSSGEVITKYIVHVKLASSVTYNISKRYSEFKTLFEILKDLIPPDYKFPNKSLFHNSAQATKDRRVRGFDQLLQILLKRKPVPTVIERFLGINERKSKSLQIRSKSLTLKRNSGVPSVGPDEAAADGGFTTTDSRNSETSGSQNGYLEQTIIPEPQPSGKEIMFSAEKYELIRSLRRETPEIITSSMKLTAVVYIAMVGVRVIDISNSDFYEILVTMCVISFALAFMRINYMKYTIAQDKLKETSAPPAETVATIAAAVVSGIASPASTQNNMRNLSSESNSSLMPILASAVVVEPSESPPVLSLVHPADTTSAETGRQ
eukprot:CAMPEP_0184969710 /NCGR_PEP_ID=MMETSP1098-20130426/2410_1 /TAXON_ID=89044 /ORGANISM="Spumella elongata, Strain CCAP 955/1" /LENGTH=333 /DNA_ID=CAMNT_0027491521 /DNA_START=70 /DNA_END=1071 /DNA_ORIENTATION=-